jgi:uncharacterized repeat protein (TIGR03837 family)
MLWHIFCKVIDNHGDIGVCWRLSCDLASRGERVVLWVDDPTALAWMAPAGRTVQAGHNEVDVRLWPQKFQNIEFSDFTVVIEAFGCEINPEYIANYANFLRLNSNNEYSWINLEYISAEPYAKANHRLPSPVLAGPGIGLSKHFFYPGFTPGTGGVLREPGLLQRQARFDRADWLKKQGIFWRGERLVSLFCYEPKALGELLAQLANGPMPVKLLVTHGRARQAVEAWFAGRMGRASTPMIRGQLSFVYLPALSQFEYDELLWSCDLNCVRGEDSLVRACLAGKPFVWHIYPQDDNAHHAKLAAFLDMMAAPSALRRFHAIWNGIDVNAALPELDLPAWRAAAMALREKLLAQPDLTNQLIDFVKTSALNRRPEPPL